MEHAWKGYRVYAWDMDELRPISSKGEAEFGGIGTTVFDAAGTLYLMGVHDELAVAHEWILGVDFDLNLDVSFFETTIQFLGGIMSAYYLSGDNAFIS